MGRSDELDAMSEADKEADILRNLREHGCVRLTSRPALAFWGAAVDRLVEAGKVQTELIEEYEAQYSYIKVTPVEA